MQAADSPLSPLPPHLPAATGPNPTANAATARFEFHGSGKEYFGIWIVNILLSIVTLGLYIPWARVRTRRYFHRNTFLAGHSFDYVADPKRLLIGYLIMGAFFVIYLTSNVINPLLALPVLLVFLVALPWLRYKSTRFYASNTTYRNLRFRFDGTLGQAYGVYMGFPALAAATLGLLLPLSSFKQTDYLLNRFAFGSFRSEFRGRIGWFFKVLYILAAIGFVLIMGAVAIFVGLVYATADPGVVAEDGTRPDPPAWVMFVPLMIYAFMFLLVGVWLVLKKNYAWSHVVMNPGPDEIAFESRLKVGRYLWILLSNVVLTIVTVGLFAPFAAVRIYRYRMDCLSAVGAERLDEVVAVVSAEPNAMGDSAADLFDFEFGL